jgi:hypothetical protein
MDRLLYWGGTIIRTETYAKPQELNPVRVAYDLETTNTRLNSFWYELFGLIWHVGRPDTTF